MKYAVIYRDTGEIYETFKEKGEAFYCITDVFGPEGHLMDVIEKEEPHD